MRGSSTEKAVGQGIEIRIRTLGGEVLARRTLTRQTLSIGRDPGCDITLPGSNVEELHARLSLKDGQIILVPENQATVLINGSSSDEPGVLIKGDYITIGAFRLEFGSSDSGHRRGRDSELTKRFSDYKAELHRALMVKADLPSLIRLEEQHSGQEWKEQLRDVLDDLLDHRGAIDSELEEFIVRQSFYRAAMDRLLLDPDGVKRTELGAKHPSYEEFRRLVDQCIESLVQRAARGLEKSVSALELSEQVGAVNKHFADAYAELLPFVSTVLRRHVVRHTLQKDLENLVFGLGPLQDLLEMPEINEIMVIGRDKIFVDRGGHLEETGRSFPKDDNLEVVIKRIVDPIGRAVNLARPIADARLDDGSRVSIVVKPVSILGPAITIRKFSQRPFTADDLVSNGTMTEQVRRFLEACVVCKKNMIIAGGTSSGKTTLLNTLSQAIPAGERIIVIEDSHELRLEQPNLVFLEARPPNMEGKGEIPIRELVRAALRMRPDRIVVGECRGKEALDMLQAMNTGHDGSLTTAHANSPQELVSRLEVMVLEAEALPIPAIHRQIAGAVDLVIQIASLRTGGRRITHVSEVVALDPDESRLVQEDIFRLVERGGREPELRFTGYLPTFVEELNLVDEKTIERVFFEGAVERSRGARVRAGTETRGAR